jgi:hypothetical protein
LLTSTLIECSLTSYDNGLSHHPDVLDIVTFRCVGVVWSNFLIQSVNAGSQDSVVSLVYQWE